MYPDRVICSRDITKNILLNYLGNSNMVYNKLKNNLCVFDYITNCLIKRELIEISSYKLNIGSTNRKRKATKSKDHSIKRKKKLVQNKKYLEDFLPVPSILIEKEILKKYLDDLNDTENELKEKINKLTISHKVHLLL